ncbi:LLM class flavin-dependent oxidoreductase [Actinomadura gamaensis]|uniref:LLM class flavin-dependent oxidoreductase n=1 Tax=Actinomadura gamaensis TaxID=1763541 RepID=A0ABV9TW94_9ACTN
MKFGVNFFPTVGPEDKHPADHFAESLDLAEQVDRLGFDHIKTVQHYFFRYGGYSPDPVTFLAAAAARTRRADLVTGAVIPAFTHPVKLAGQLAMLDNISRGRLRVGFGRAFLPDEFDAFGVALDDSRALFDERVEAIRRLWSEEDLVWEGRFDRFGPVTLLPRPYQRPHPPILVTSAISPESAQAAGRNGYGLMLVPSILPRERLQETIAGYREAWTAAGHPEGAETIHLSYGSYVAENSSEAYEKGKAYSERTNATLVEAVSAWSTARSEAYRGYEKIVERVAKSDFDRSLKENKSLVGSPDEIVDRLREIRTWFGDVTLSLQVISGAPPYEESLRTVTLFAEKIIPALST